jgi:Tol biopolymer transport system component
VGLSTGTKLGAYEVSGQLGAGGMGEVYRATDARLGRDVAIKTLPAALADDRERLARFEREARLLASLNHVHIASVYGLDEHEGSLYIAMELVEGETLEEILKAGPLPVDKALEIGRQIAQALEAAHDKGVVHRDLKPANVMVSTAGVVKVLDFGLAKAFMGDPNEASPAHSPALSVAMTQQGLVLGTAGYMSPEQASGQATDQRADVWAFGVVMFEMLTGMPLFAGESVPHVLAAVLQTNPDWSRLPKNLHPRIRQMLERCLEKKPANRYAGITDARVDIDRALADPEGFTETALAEQSVARRPSAVWLAASALLTAGVAAVLAWSLWPDAAPRPVNRFAIELPSAQILRNTGRHIVALSPDGRQFAYNTTRGIYLRRMGQLEAALLPETGETLTNPFFSPDSQSLAYYAFAGGNLKRISVNGGAPVIMASGLSNVFGASWSDDDTILFGQEDGIYRVPAAGNAAPDLVVPRASDTERLHGPSLLPDGDTVLFTAAEGSEWDSAVIAAYSLSTGERRVVHRGGSDARYVPTGHLVYAFSDDLFAVPFDLETLTVMGGPVSLVQGVMRAAANATGAANYAFSLDGTLVYVTGEAAQELSRLVWVDRSNGRETLIDAPPRNYQYLQLSPDGSRIALDSRDEESDIWIFDLARETLQRLTFDPGLNRATSWSPDGQRVAFSREIDGTEELYWQIADGSSPAEPLTADSGQPLMPNDISPDGERLYYMPVNSPRDIFVVPIGEPEAAEPLLNEPTSEEGAAISPNGRWIAYQSDESGSFEIYVRPLPDVGLSKFQISTSGGTRPLWRRDGRELFYIVDDASLRVMAVSIDDESGFRAGTPRLAIEGDYSGFISPNQGRHVYDISLDGQQFLMLKNAGTANSNDEPRTDFVIVQNWFERLRRDAPVR